MTKSRSQGFKSVNEESKVVSAVLVVSLVEILCEGDKGVGS